ncbi:hypothetical protein H0H92_009250 [Tricholoma furcatifolium]|nr:hypothetical protein H0H92_009250 [Tricholoma furcatifolium]
MSAPSTPPAPSPNANDEHDSCIISSSPSNVSSATSPVTLDPETSLLPAVNAPSTQVKPLTDILGEKFPSFDHHTSVVSPFHEEMSRDADFEKELGLKLLDAILETHAWAASRPKHESSFAAQSIEKRIVSVMEAEKEQGMFLSRPRLSPYFFAGIVDLTRQQLNQFVSQIKMALSALTGLGGI